MNYLNERALYYYFLMQETGEAGVDFWKFIAGFFGVKSKEIAAYEKVLVNPVLAELSTIGDVEMYKNYLSGFSCAENEFGKSVTESDAIEAKALALHKSCSLYGNDYSLKGGRLRVLSHSYEKDHFASVLYALQVLYLHNNEDGEKFAENILVRELKESNSDAGLILLKLKKDSVSETMAYLSSTPDMRLRPDVLNELKKRYGGGDGGIFKNKRVIGF